MSLQREFWINPVWKQIFQLDRNYSPGMVFLASLMGAILGGDIVGAGIPGGFMTLWLNCRTNQQTQQGNKILILGFLSFAAMVVLGEFLPQRNHARLIVAIVTSFFYTGIFKSIARKMQVTATNEEHPNKSWWFTVITGLAMVMISILMASLIHIIFPGN